MSTLITYLSEFTIYQYIVLLVNIAGALFIYINRKALLFDKGQLSLGRVWSWILFYIALSYWARYIMGTIPPTTSFPPCLDDLLYACLFYELFKRCLDKDLLKLILLRKTKLPLQIDSDDKK